MFYDVPTRTLRWSEGSLWRCSSPSGVVGRMRSWDLVWTSPVYVGLVLTGLEVAWWPDGWKARAGWRRNGPSSARRTRTHGCLCQYRPHLGTNEHMPCSLGKQKQGRRGFMKIFTVELHLTSYQLAKVHFRSNLISGAIPRHDFKINKELDFSLFI